MRFRRFLRSAVRIGASLLLLLAFGSAVYVFVEANIPATPARAMPPTISVTAIPHIAVSPYRDSVPVLVYHDIADRPGRYTVAPRQFAEQMAALHSAGFHAISAAQMIGFLHGRNELPIRPLLITFDDGLGSAWRVADPIIARYGMRAIDFVISGQLGQHGFYYLHPDELRAMIGSGRWDIEAHTHLAHLYVPIDRFGDYGPALTNREWLPRENRVETRREFTLRVQRDLDLNIKELRGYGADPALFAYPFSASRDPTNDPGVIPILHRLVAQRFEVSFVDGDGGQFLSPYNTASKQQLPRLEVYSNTSASALLDRLSTLAPIQPRIPNALFDSRQWVYGNGNAIGGSAPIVHDMLRLRLRARRWLAVFLAPQNSDQWRNYRVGVTLRGLGSKGSGTSDTLLIGSADAEHYAVTVSAGGVSVVSLSKGGVRRLLWSMRIRGATVHSLDVALQDARLRIAVDGASLVALAVAHQTHGGIGLGGWRGLVRSPTPSFTRLSVAPLSGR